MHGIELVNFYLPSFSSFANFRSELRAFPTVRWVPIPHELLGEVVENPCQEQVW